MRLVPWLVALLCLLAASAGASPTPSGYRAILDGKAAPPEGWKLDKVMTASPEQVSAFGAKLGVSLNRVVNTVSSSTAGRVQINLIECASPGDALAARTFLVRLHGNNADYALADENNAIEFVSKDPRAVRRAHYAFGFRPRVATYRITFSAAPVDSGDDSVWNDFFNLFLRLDARTDVERTSTEIERLKPHFRFANTLRLRAEGLGPHQTAYSFVPTATSSEMRGDLFVATFSKLNEKAGVPIVTVKATVTSEAFAVRPTERAASPELLGPTPFWPADDPELVALAAHITEGRTTPRGKLFALLDWFLPGRNIRYGDGTIGSRNGVRSTMQEKTGRCWDFSDLFTTLARAAGLPCRQVAGWLHGGEGHVWAEVLLEGEGWLQVDPTAGMECTAEYIPYLTSEDGTMPLVYASAVRIEP